MLPLLALLALQAVAFVRLWPGADAVVTVSSLSSTTRAVALGWSGFNLVLLLLALRCCWDRGGGSAVPWFRPLGGAPVLLRSPDPERPPQPADVLALSEEGIEFEWTTARAPTPGTAFLQVEGLPGVEPLPLVVEQSAAGRVRSRRGRGAGRWGALTPAQWDQLQTLLYRRPGLWPLRRAPFEPLALPALLRLLLPSRPEGPFRRSLIPQSGWSWGTSSVP